MMAPTDSKSKPLRHHLHEHYGIGIPPTSTILIWIIGACFVISLTIKDFWPLLRDYRYNNYATLVNVQEWDDEFEPPHLVVCLPRRMIRNKYGNSLMALAHYLNGSGSDGSGKLVYEKLSNVSWDVWNDDVKSTPVNRDSFEDMYSNLSLAFAHRLLKLSIDSENLFDRKYTDWNEPLASSILNILEWQTLLDYYLSNIQPDPAVKFALSPSSEYLHDINNFDTKLYLWFNRTLDRMCNTISLGYKEYEQSNEFDKPRMINRSCTDWLLGGDTPVLFGTFGLWAALPKLEIPQIMQYRFIVPKSLYDPLLAAELGSDPFNKIYLYPDQSILYVNTMDPTFSTYIADIPLDMLEGGYKVIARYSVQLRTRDTRAQCQDTNAKASYCSVRCTKEWIIQKCKCVLFSFKVGLTNLSLDGIPFCLMNDYLVCNLTKLPDQVRDECRDRCKASCIFTTYNWQINYETFEPEKGVNELLLKTVPIFDTFAEFSMTTKNTPEQFYSQLAGIVSFYLGFSGITLFALTVSFLEWYINYKKMKVRTNVQEQKVEDRLAGDGNMVYLNVFEKYGTADQGLLVRLKAELRKELKAELTEHLERQRRDHIEGQKTRESEEESEKVKSGNESSETFH